MRDTTSSSNNDDESASASQTNAIKWGIIGLGDVCTVKAGPAFYKCHGSTLAAVMRRTPGAAERWIDANIKDNNFPESVASTIRGYQSVDDMMREEDLDAIYVCTPPGAHLQVVREIVSATSNHNIHNLKAVYLEKPCGRCSWETRAIVDELTQRGIQFYPAYVSRAHERTQVIRKLLGVNKVCGDRVTSIQYKQRGSSLARGLSKDTGGVSNNVNTIPWRLDTKQSGGGLIMDMGCHILDRIDYLFGPITVVNSTVLRKGSRDDDDDDDTSSYPLVEDFVSMNAKIGQSDWSAITSEGATVHCVWDFSPQSEIDADRPEEDELTIHGPTGSMRMAGMGAAQPIKVFDADGKLVRTLEFNQPEHAAQPLIQSVVDELRGKTSAKCSARSDNAVRTSEVLDTILNSYYGGRHDAYWLREDAWPGLRMDH